jgi:hypothetical protein
MKYEADFTVLKDSTHFDKLLDYVLTRKPCGPFTVTGKNDEDILSECKTKGLLYIFYETDMHTVFTFISETAYISGNIKVNGVFKEVEYNEKI